MTLGRMAIFYILMAHGFLRQFLWIVEVEGEGKLGQTWAGDKKVGT